MSIGESSGNSDPQILQYRVIFSSPILRGLSYSRNPNAKRSFQDTEFLACPCY